MYVCGKINLNLSWFLPISPLLAQLARISPIGHRNRQTHTVADRFTEGNGLCHFFVYPIRSLGHSWTCCCAHTCNLSLEKCPQCQVRQRSRKGFKVPGRSNSRLSNRIMKRILKSWNVRMNWKKQRKRSISIDQFLNYSFSCVFVFFNFIKVSFLYYC